LLETAWVLTKEDIGADVDRMFGGNFLEFLKR